MTEEKEIQEKEAGSDNSVLTLQGTVIFKLMNEGSKSEGDFPFLKLADTHLIPIYLENSNPFENTTLKEFEDKEINAQGTMKEDVFYITKIAPCSKEEKEL